MAVHSEFLSKLTPDERENLVKELWEKQNHKCFVSGQEIDLELHKDEIDIDHVIAISRGGADDPSNFALELAGPNRSKSDKDLNYARSLWNYKKFADKVQNERNESPNLEDVLKLYGGSKYELEYKIEDNFIKFTYSKMGQNEIISLPYI